MTLTELSRRLEGHWSGNCSLWLDPAEAPEVTPIAGQFFLPCGENFLRHCYRGIAAGKPHHGEETIVWSQYREVLEVYWIDDFHMNYAVQRSVGRLTDSGYEVMGHYEVGRDQPDWGWRTVLDIQSENRIEQTAFNLPPDGQGEEAIAVRIEYERMLVS